MDAFFSPKTVAVIGATDAPDSVGRTLFSNLSTGAFPGTVFPVNTHRATVLGHRAYPNVAALPERVDLAVIATPAATVPGVIRECTAAGVKAAVIITAGFRETGPAGLALEQQILTDARAGRMRIIGPNCIGLMNPLTGLNATFAASIARPGNVGFISQSGALCTSILDWSLREKVGFSAFVSVGSMLDIGWGDLIQHLGDDPRTHSIVIYMESIGDAAAFLSAAREVALNKPIIVIKAGRTEAAAKAAASHTGSLTGSDDVLDAAFLRCGVLRVDRISDLFYMSEILGKQPRPRGPRLTILSNAGGPAVLATDALIADGGQLAALAPQTLTALDEILPPHWSHQNPIDIIGDAGPDRYAHAMEIASKDPNSDGLLVILSPQGMTSPSEIAERLKPFAKLQGKPVLASWMGGDQVAGGEHILNDAGIPTFPFPDTAARVFNYMWRYSVHLRSLYETPAYPDDAPEIDAASAHNVIAKASAEGRVLLTEAESKQILAAYGIPVAQTQVAASVDTAVEWAAKIGYPVVLKLHSETITHKSDVGGVQLNLADEGAVRVAYAAIERGAGDGFQGVAVQPMIRERGYELILGSSVDAQFGPVILFGAGGELVEVLKDRALGLPPLNTTLARRLMEQTRIYKALPGVRGRKPVDLEALEQLVVRFSQLVTEQRWIKEIDINPFLVSSEQMIALDARIVLHPADRLESELPRTAIRPYPSQYATQWTAKDGLPVTVRPIRPEDEPMMVRFHETLSDESVYFRYFHLIKLGQRVDHERLTRQCFADYNRDLPLVAEREDSKTGERGIIAVGRMNKLHGAEEAEVAVIVSDRHQRLGLGTRLVASLIEIARKEKIGRLVANVLPDNRGMRLVFEGLGFKMRYSLEEEAVEAELRL